MEVRRTQDKRRYSSFAICTHCLNILLMYYLYTQFTVEGELANSKVMLENNSRAKISKYKCTKTYIDP